MILQLKAYHFKNTEYYSDKCAIGKALREVTNNNWYLGSNFAEDTVSRTEYSFENYSQEEFQNDSIAAQAVSFDKTVIREIEIPSLPGITKNLYN